MTLSTIAAAQSAAPAVPLQLPFPPPQVPPALPPAKVIDLLSTQGQAVFGAQWRIMEAKIVEGAAIEGAMPDYKSSYDLQPHAGEPGFDDSAWPVTAANGPGEHRGGGKVSFIWYRTRLTIPAKIDGFDPSGATAVLTLSVDDYAEIWINGQLPRRAGIPSPATIQGYNMPNRVVLAESVKPGDRFQIAICGINGPISAAPMNFVWVREAQIEFYDDSSLRGRPH